MAKNLHSQSATSSPPNRASDRQSPALTSEKKSLTLLGGGPLPQLASPDEAVLESFESPSECDYEVTFSTQEFTSHCPVTGQPDFAEIIICYTPDRRCIESKSLKQYLGAYRNQAVFAEGIVNKILNDLVAAIAPRRATVIGDFSPRGGIGIRVEATHESSKKNVKSGKKSRK